MNKIFWTSDLHFCHKNIATKFRGYNDENEMGNDIVKIWNSVVSKNDDVYVLGDLSIDISYKKLLPWLSQLNGNIIVIGGNHDRKKEIKKLVELGIIEYQGEMIYKKIPYAQDMYIDVHATHYPILYWRKMENGSYHFHGHTHNIYEGPARCVDVGWDKWKRPMETKELMNYCEEKEKSGKFKNPKKMTESNE